MKAQTAEENGFKETEIGLIPSDWDVVELTENSVARLIMGQSPPSSTYNKDKQGVPFLQGKAEFGSVNPSPEKWCTKPSRIAEKNDILISVRAPVGDVNISPFQCSIGRGLAAIRADKKSLPHFLFYYLQYSKKRIEDEGTGSTFKAINKSVLEHFKISLPEITEQQKISFVLSKIQQAIEQQNKIIQITKELKKSLMNKFFTEGLHGEEQKETEIGMMPKSWDVKKLGDVFEIQQGKQLSSKFQKGISPYPFLRTANVLWGRIDILTVDSMDFTPKEVAKLTLKKEDLLVCEGGDIGRTAMWDEQLSLCLYQNHLHRLRPLKKDILPKFYMYWMQVAHLYLRIYEGAGNRTTIPNLSQSRLRLFLLPTPSLDEQKEIANILSNIDKKIQQLESRKQTLQCLFKTMLNQLMTGRVRVKDLDIEVN